jgi:probable F420-dependent oxidoreductase
MSPRRPLRFGLQLSTLASGQDLPGLARKVEDLGYSSLVLPDHFGDQLAPVPALAVAAAATTRLRVGALVFANDYRHPVVLAKEAATIDVLSGGSLELGLGAGWMNTDYEQSGIPQDSAGVRVDRMAEAVTVLKGLFADEPFSFSGEHYTIAGLNGLPKPVQRPNPPLLIGGGSRRVLSIAGREADIVGINLSVRSGAVDAAAGRSAIASETDRKLAWVRAAAGPRYDEIELNMLVFAALITSDRDAAVHRVAPRFGVEPADFDDYPHALLGSKEEVSEQIQRARERWDISYWVLQANAVDAFAPVVAELAGT